MDIIMFGAVFEKAHNPVHVVGLRPGILLPPPGVEGILQRAQVLVAGRRLLEARTTRLCAGTHHPHRWSAWAHS